ncbi:hypothetical protein SAMN06265222_11720 [Neorhodopirellula lusitana]|uniref:Uncharacterized protein n=1 Tax=Neorhodopirellula lusitana TaxID=445327 RepID=A0ABY1QJX2_9BACT|nr:hypothetical protein SAMN06265222_11720 [Neorhodopirellula lusitana]
MNPFMLLRQKRRGLESGTDQAAYPTSRPTYEAGANHRQRKY